MRFFAFLVVLLSGLAGGVLWCASLESASFWGLLLTVLNVAIGVIAIAMDLGGPPVPKE